jgi:predicted transposase/invertase (TIGR01784 family)
MSFLNSMLPESHQISVLSFQKTEQLPDHQDDRKTIFDILCEDKNGEKFIIEMQKSRMTHFMDRSVYYSTFPIQSQAQKGKWDFKLTRVYLIAILDFEYDKNEKYWKKRQLLRTFSLRDEKGVVMTNNLHFKFLQLPLFKKKRHQLKTQFDKWCFFLNNLENIDKIPNILNEPIFMKAFDVATVNNMDPNDYILYQISKSKKYDMEILQDEARERGMEQGLEQGMKQGIEKGMEKGIEKGMEKATTEYILTLHSKSFSALQISDMLSIPVEKVMFILEKYTHLDVN